MAEEMVGGRTVVARPVDPPLLHMQRQEVVSMV